MPEEQKEQHLLPLEQQIAIVTGAAKGIGRGIAVEMARAGADIVLADVDEEGMDETARTITALGRASLNVRTDIQEIAQGHQLIDAAFQRFGKVDILVNNAGVNTPGPRQFLEVSAESYDRVLQTNLRGSFFLAQRMAQVMIEKKIQGSILFTSSTHARIISLQSPYSASKAGIEMLVREMALELAEYTIRVNAVAPGWIAVREPADKRATPFVPLGYMGEPVHIAHAMVFLASRYASYITGQTLTVDGGFSLTHNAYWHKRSMLRWPTEV